jgi:hypothetical protein
MPLNSEDLPTNSRQEFCLALKAVRERQGITLNQIAEATKIPASLFAALERNDLRHWPHGLFRRSFFRDYAGMIGLPATEACAQFVRLFVDDEKAEVAVAGRAPTPAEVEGVRLVLDAAWHGPRASVRSRVLAALIDGGLVTVAGILAGWLTGISWPISIAIVALAYFSLATAVLDKSPASWAIAKGKSLVSAPTPVLTTIAAACRQVLGRTDTTGTEDPEMRPWVTDARRVAPAPSPRFRARIKLPH